jgi:hypothetical protein
MKNGEDNFLFYLFIFLWNWGLNLGPCTCSAGALPLVPHLQLSFCFNYFSYRVLCLLFAQGQPWIMTLLLMLLAF